jgi:hypothetical protein
VYTVENHVTLAASFVLVLLLDLPFNPEDVGDILLRNFG